MSDSEPTLQAIVESWLTDVDRRGAKLYAMNNRNEMFNLSFEGKHGLRFGVKIDIVAKDVRVQITGPLSNFIERYAFLLSAENLRSLANRMCLVGEGKAIVPVYLIAQLSVLCHAYQRLLEDYGHEFHTGSSKNTLQRIETELRQHLTPKEQKRTDNPLLQARRRARKAKKISTSANQSKPASTKRVPHQG
jgi:hypothetical protein